MPTPKKDKNGLYRVRWTDAHGKRRETTAKTYQGALEKYQEKIAAKVSGKEIEPLKGRVTVEKWCERWLASYALNSPGTRKMGITHVKVIVKTLGRKPLSKVDPDTVRQWVAELHRQGYSHSYIYALHNRLSQILGEAVHDGYLSRNPCSRRTSPGGAKTVPYVITTEQVWALYDAMPEQCRSAVLLGAFAGLRIAEAAGLRRQDVDLESGVIRPTVQYGGVPLKTADSKASIPIPLELADVLRENLEPVPGWTMVVPGQLGQGISPTSIEVHFRRARATVEGLPTDKLRFHDLRHYYASLLIQQGLDVKRVQQRLRHSSAKITLDTYGHLFEDDGEATRSAIGSAMRRPVPRRG